MDGYQLYFTGKIYTDKLVMYQKTSLSVVIYRFFPLIATAGMAGFHHLNFDLLLVTWPLVISELKLWTAYNWSVLRTSITCKLPLYFGCGTQHVIQWIWWCPLHTNEGIEIKWFCGIPVQPDVIQTLVNICVRRELGCPCPNCRGNYLGNG